VLGEGWQVGGEGKKRLLRHGWGGAIFFRREGEGLHATRAGGEKAISCPGDPGV